MKTNKFDIKKEFSGAWYETADFFAEISGFGGGELIQREGYTIVVKMTGMEQPACNHQWIDVGFMQSKIVCKHCNQEQS